MRIYTNKSFRFTHPTGAFEPVTTQALSFSNVPDWVAQSTLFKLALKDGSVNVIDSKADEVKAEVEANEKPKRKTPKQEAGE